MFLYLVVYMFNQEGEGYIGANSFVEF